MPILRRTFLAALGGAAAFGGGTTWRVERSERTNPDLLPVLLVGDSILNGYRAKVKQLLESAANVDAWVNPYHQASGGLNEMQKQVATSARYDVIHFNIGLHGWQKGRIPEGQLLPLTRRYVQAFRDAAPKARLIWASSTPVTVKGRPLELDPEINPVIVEHNAMAAQVMKEFSIPINDLYALALPHLEWARGDSFHWTQPAYDLMAAAIAKSIRPV